jgi:hypothetical protein
MNVRFCALRMLWCELERGQGAAGREPNGTSQWKTVNAPTQATEGTENNQQTPTTIPLLTILRLIPTYTDTVPLSFSGYGFGGFSWNPL